jgi:formate dehydrogenase maturation protein FdhE
LDSLFVSGYKKEIERCINIYESFEEGAGFIESIFKTLDNYFKQLSELAPVLDPNFIDKDKSAEMMRQDTSIRFRPEVDTKLFKTLFELVCDEAIKTNPSLKKVIAEVKITSDNYLRTSGETVSLEKLSELKDMLIKETAMECDMATFLFSVVLSSIYRRQFESLSEVLRTDLYEGGDCPLCGEKPHYGMLCAEDGAKKLECWLCGTQWVHTRVKCPYCSNEEREELGYFTKEGSDICRVYYCHSCCRYYKVIDARKFNMDGSYPGYPQPCYTGL